MRMLTTDLFPCTATAIPISNRRQWMASMVYTVICQPASESLSPSICSYASACWCFVTFCLSCVIWPTSNTPRPQTNSPVKIHRNMEAPNLCWTHTRKNACPENSVISWEKNTAEVFQIVTWHPHEGQTLTVFQFYLVSFHRNFSVREERFILKY